MRLVAPRRDRRSEQQPGQRNARVDTQDGLRLAWNDRWLHVRPSGTEPIIRYIAEAPTAVDAESLVGAAQELVHEE